MFSSLSGEIQHQWLCCFLHHPYHGLNRLCIRHPLSKTKGSQWVQGELVHKRNRLLDLINKLLSDIVFFQQPTNNVQPLFFYFYQPTRDDRGWFINPLGPNPWWTAVITLVPALLCTILIFMDQQITAVIINRKEHKLKVLSPPSFELWLQTAIVRSCRQNCSTWPLSTGAFPLQKGCGYHLDLLMVGVMLGVCSLMGLPWFVAATVLSISHVNSLKLESECSAPGEQPKFLGIREQRFTGLMIFTLMGCSVFMTSVLKVRRCLFVICAFWFMWHKVSLCNTFLRRLIFVG